MTSSAALKVFIETILKEEKMKLSKKEIEKLADDLFDYYHHNIVFEAEEIQKDFVC